MNKIYDKNEFVKYVNKRAKEMFPTSELNYWDCYYVMQTMNRCIKEILENGDSVNIFAWWSIKPKLFKAVKRHSPLLNIDLNGHSLTTNSINNEGKCVIKNSSQNGFIKNESHFRGTQHLISNLGTMELLNVDIRYFGSDSSGVSNVSYAPDVTVLYNQGTCLANGIKIDSKLTYSSTSTCTSLMYNYGIYNENGNITIENYKCNTSSKLNVRNSKTVVSYQYGIYCKSGEVTYISGTIDSTGFAISFVGDAIDSRYQIYNYLIFI